MESWREELYASNNVGYFLMHGRTKGVKNGEGKMYPYRSHTRHKDGQLTRAQKENVKGNGRGIEDAGMAAIGVTAAVAGGAAGAAALKNRASKKAISSMSNDELIDLAGKYELQGTRLPANSGNKGSGNKEDPTLKAMGSLNDAFQQGNRGIKDIYSGIDDIIRATKDSNIDLSGYSNEELQRAITRANLERQFSEIQSADQRKARQIVNGTLTAIGGVSATGAAVLTSVFLINKLVNGG